MHLLHLSIGSSDTTLANPIHVPSLSLPAFPILRCKLHVRIRSFILHFLQTIFFPTVPPLLLVYSAAHALLTPVSLDFQPMIHSPHTSQYTSVSTVLSIAIQSERDPVAVPCELHVTSLHLMSAHGTCPDVSRSFLCHCRSSSLFSFISQIVSSSLQIPKYSSVRVKLNSIP